MWSTTVAYTLFPSRVHSLQNGSTSRCSGLSLSFQIGSRYQSWYSALLPRWYFGLCLGHQPSRVSSAHPGCLQGRSGLLAMGYHLQGTKQTKRAGADDKHARLRSHRLRLSKHWPRSISTMFSVLQYLQYATTPVAVVSGKIFISRL